jgi:hypothetical protein
MGAELSTYEGNATEQASTNSRNSTRSTSRTETHRKSREVLRLVRSLEVRADFYELKEKHNGAGQKRDVDERKEVKNEGPSCYVSPYYNYHVLVWVINDSHTQIQLLLASIIRPLSQANVLTYTQK